MAVPVAVIALGWVLSMTLGTLLSALLDLIWLIDITVNPRTKARRIAHSILLAEYLREESQQETER